MSHVTFPYLGIEFDINRVAFSIGDFPVYWYGILIALGMLIGILLAQKNAKLVGLKDDDVLDVILISAVIAVLSGRAFYVLFASDYHVSNIKEFLNLRGGGTAFYGVLLGAIISCIIVCKIKKMPILPFLDNMGIGFLVGQGIGRWGNFFNQELFGTNTDLPWAMYSDTISRYVSYNAARLYSEHGIELNDAPVHPTFLYESIWCLIGFVILYRLLKKRRFDGEVFLTYLVWNGIGRAFIEQLRTDALFLGRIRISQFVCSLLAILALTALFIIRSSIRRYNDDEYLMTYAKRKELADKLAQESEEDNDDSLEDIKSEENVGSEAVQENDEQDDSEKSLDNSEEIFDDSEDEETDYQTASDNDDDTSISEENS
ncbi:MAG: prolipoprotein diacylglyceryl transferase [Oscillospiraceae bacterium]|nr:prolipoprotein diacylglyceryl transferase [Oscillospiraceae bacterium]